MVAMTMSTVNTRDEGMLVMISAIKKFKHIMVVTLIQHMVFRCLDRALTIYIHTEQSVKCSHVIHDAVFSDMAVVA